MDYLRGPAYSVEVSPYRDDLARTVRRVWYFVPHRADPGFENSFLSTIYHKRLPAGIGEVPHTRRRYGGQPPYLVTRPGRLCGSAEQWREGVLTTDPPREIDLNTGVPLCCGPQPIILGRGGEIQGGYSTVQLLIGGEAEGGASSADLVFSAQVLRGGEAQGGGTALAGELLAAGGEAQGGTANQILKFSAAGGEAQGGNSNLAEARYAVEARLDWSNDSDLDLYVGVQHGTEAHTVWYNNLSGGGLTLNHDGYPGCFPVAFPPELTTGEFDGDRVFLVRYNQFSDCQVETPPSIARFRVTNIGGRTITANLTPLTPGQHADFPLAYYGYNTGPNPTGVGTVVTVLTL